MLFCWMKIQKNERRTIKRILKYIDCCIVLHNLLIELDEDDVPEEWIDTDDFSDLDDLDRMPSDSEDELNKAVPDGAPDDSRRTQLNLFINETFVP